MKTLISVVGATAIGKTSLAIALAKHFQTEIISCDSRQFFAEMNIGTAKPTEAELAEVDHHFIGQLSVTDYYSIGQYELESLAKLEKLFLSKEVVIMVGGSMMYEKAVLEGLHQLPEANAENQRKLTDIWENEGLKPLQELLKSLDPAYYLKVDLQNPRRLLRAIDVIWQTGKSYTQNIADTKEVRNFRSIRIGIEADRAVIYERINTRVDAMMEAGLLAEVQKLAPYKELVPLQTVSYTELFKYLDHEWDLDFAVSEIKKNSRRFAKRQLTWYRGDENIHWVNYENAFSESLSLLKNLMQDSAAE